MLKYILMIYQHNDNENFSCCLASKTLSLRVNPEKIRIPRGLVYIISQFLGGREKFFNCTDCKKFMFFQILCTIEL